MAKPDQHHFILLSLMDGVGFTEKGQTLLVNNMTGGVAVYIYNEKQEDLLQIVYEPRMIPRMSIIAKKLPIRSLRRHIYRRHGGWQVLTDNLELYVENGLLT